MGSVASPPPHSSDHPAIAEYPPQSLNKPERLISSTWQILEQPPPPSLREILGAYRTRGDGDREMLMAMLNAKSAEDQRIASMASLHRSMLEYYQLVPPSAHQSPNDHPYLESFGAYSHPGLSPQSNGNPSSYSPRINKEPHRSSHTVHPRKRHRTSESPHANHHSVPRAPTPSSPPQLPSSPYSSTRSDSTQHSPHSRSAMDIGSLLSAGAREAAREEAERRGSPRDGIMDRAAPVRGHHSNANSVAVVSV
ncbi:hypothetical protein HETIRDRAFT_413862 [Heterobasidion irregulare TC 32-1]|uniref:Uncharacterized protein n=1 Tax=Heterobasidion irregulare (strain TC 32-1) TaxID=747525 RepID=W4KQ72_HETIT|nr:uncharacterized protein HETIRDRAFT_413862 [Heterobasidion irregulare TC 32-1]ETW87550.1 hypothetical protein HETIRDRAFT_413862 [Heterobasidion irregulare TC 32-1]